MSQSFSSIDSIPSSAAPEDFATKKRRVERRLLSFGGTKHALNQILTTLHTEGMLGKELQPRGTSTMAKDLRNSLAALGRDASTAYGPIVKQMHLGLQEPLLRCPVVCPLAWLAHFSAACESFARVLKSTIDSTAKPLRIVIYIDEIQPGNPLRPDKTRCTQAVYWSFVDFPDWLLCRAEGWFFFCGIRSSVVSQLHGGVSEFCRLILQFFFSRPLVNFDIGCFVTCRQDSALCRGVFEGLLMQI